MINNTMGILFAWSNESKLGELTTHRTTASLPFGGRYRLIDFILSNLVNSGISQVGIVTRSSYQSLMDHIRQGRDWDLNRKNGGISVFPPFVYNNNGRSASREVYRGKIEALNAIMSFLRHSPEQYVVLSNCNVAANIDFEKVYRKHIESGAEITMLCYEGMTTSLRRLVLNRGDDGFVTDIYETESVGEESKEISMGTYFIKKDLLIEKVLVAYNHGSEDFEREIIFPAVSEGKVYGYRLDKYVAIVDDVKTYYNESMRLLDEEARNQLFSEDSKIFTKVKDSVPTVYGERARVENSLIADGCIINGTVINSVIFRKVRIEEGATVKNSIIMENGVVGEKTQVTYAITDKDVNISGNRTLSGYYTYPIVIAKGHRV